MSWFDSFIVQPIFNLLMAIYAFIPGQDFGIALIIFAIITRYAMWPLVKKQLHQIKLQKQIQPELKKVKEKAAGNKQLEGQMMLELYRERGVNPFAPIGVLIIQLPIFIALFQVVMMITSHREKIEQFTYGFIATLPPVAKIIENPGQLSENFLGLVDLTKTAFHGGTIYWPLMVLAVFSAWLQYYQSKQITPTTENSRKLRDILKDSSQGKQADQADISAAMNQNMIKIIPFIAFFAAVSFPGALVLFYAASSLVAIVQQHFILQKDVEEMKELAVTETKPKKAKPQKPSDMNNSAEKRAKAAQPATIVRTVKKPVQKRRKGSKVK